MQSQTTKRRRLAPVLAVMMFAAVLGIAVGGPASPASAAVECQGYIYESIDEAKASFRDDRCGRDWNDQVRDQCTWVAEPVGGWVCHTHAPNGPVNPQAPPSDEPPPDDQPSPDDPPTATGSTAASARSKGAKDVSGYWTKERMEGATDVMTGQPVSKGGTDNSVPAWFAKTTGRVFFEMPHISEGQFSCTGSVVNTKGKNSVWTAGHCLHLDGQWATNVMFAPGYDSGETPYGEWTWQQLWSLTHWTNGGATGQSCGTRFGVGDVRSDMGVVILRPLNGRSIVDVTGGNGIRLNPPATGSATAYSYERGSSADGCGGTATSERRLVGCSSQLNTFGQNGLVGVTCPNFGAGSSGGGIFTSVNGDGRYLSGVISTSDPARPGVHFTPYFGEPASILYGATKDL